MIDKKEIKLIYSDINRINRKSEIAVKKILKITGKNVKTILDIGGCIGTFSLHFANMLHHKDLKIYTFEPVRSSYDILVSNIKINNFEKYIEPFNFGFNNKKGSVIMGVPIEREKENNMGLYRIESVDESPVCNKVVCEMERLSSFIKNKKIQKIDIMKIDVEGSEINILKDSSDVLKKVEYIHIEINRNFKGSNDISKFLKSMGFIHVGNTRRSDFIWKNCINTG